MKMSVLQLMVEYRAGNEEFLNEVLAVLQARQVYKPTHVYRTIQRKNASRVLRHGTDRHGRRPPQNFRKFETLESHAYSDVIDASTEQEIRDSLLSGSGGTALSKVLQFEHSSMVVYDAGHFQKVPSAFGHYLFKDSTKKLEAVVVLVHIEMP